jgi:hypothetical protein
VSRINQGQQSVSLARWRFEEPVFPFGCTTIRNILTGNLDLFVTKRPNDQQASNNNNNN